MRWSVVVALLMVGCDSKPAPPCQGVAVIEKGSGARVLATAEEAQRGILQGDYEPATDRLRVRGHGKFGSVATQDLAIALGQGNELADPGLSKEAPTCRTGDNLRRNRVHAKPHESPAGFAYAEPQPQRASELPTEVRPRLAAPPPSPAPVVVAKPKPLKLQRTKASACGLEVSAPAKLAHRQLVEDPRSTVDLYTGEGDWGSVMAMCIHFDPRPSTSDLLATADVLLGNVRKAQGAKVLGEREKMIGKYPATEIDTVAGGTFSRWRIFVAGEVIHAHAITTADEARLDELLSRVRVVGKAARVSKHAPLYPFASSSYAWGGDRPSTSLPSSSWSPSPNSSSLPTLKNNGPVHVDAYTRKDGTRVRAHTRSR